MVQGSVVAAQDILEKRSAQIAMAVVDAAPRAAPLRSGSLIKDAHAMLRAETGRAVRPSQDCGPDRRPWMERHPVWTGALLGFGPGALLTYAAGEGHDDEAFKNIGAGAATLFWGGVSSGVGALAGWGIGRNRDDGDRGCGG